MEDDEEEMRRLRNRAQRNAPQKVQQQQQQVEEKEEEDEEQAALRQLNLPTSFGPSRITKTNTRELIEKTARPPGPQRAPKYAQEGEPDFVGPPRPPAPQESTDQREEFEVFEDEETVNYYKIPFSNEIKLDGHHRTVSAVALDPSGSRLLTGGHDTYIKMWDWAGMDASLRSFRSLEPAEGNPIKSIQYSRTGDRFLVATSNSQAKLYDRDGIQLAECVKGDMYLTDMSNTKGHVAGLGNAVWHPDASQNDTFITCSLDSTIRIWNVEKMELKGQTSVLKVKGTTGRKVGVTYITMNPDGSLIAAGCQDGSLQLWSFKAPYNRPKQVIRDAHIPGNDVSCLCFGSDGFTLVSRSMDDTMKVWDIRKANEAVAVFNDLPNFGDVDCIFSPDGQLIITGTCMRRGEGTGLLVFYDRSTLRRAKQIGFGKGVGVVSMLWHPKINQIVVGTSEGKAHVLFDPQLSKKGALLSVSRAPREKDPNDYEPPRPILTPHALPMFYETPNMKRKLARERFDPRKGAKLEIQQSIDSGPGHAGRLGSSVTQHLMKHYIRKDISRDEDPREAILRHAAEADSNPYWFAAYQKTQPVPIFNTEEIDEDELVPRPKEKDKKKS